MTQSWRAVFGAGHRLLTDEQTQWVQAALAEEVYDLRAGRGMREAVSGMIPGSEQLWASAAVAAGVPLHAVLPYPSQPNDPTATLSVVWTRAQRTEWARLVDEASRLTRVSPRDPVTVEDRRDMLAAHMRHAVDLADAVVAVWNPQVRPKGTYATIEYAVGQGKPVVWLDPVARVRREPAARDWTRLLKEPC